MNPTLHNIAISHFRAEIEQGFHSLDRDLVRHSLYENGTPPTRTFTVVFSYDDGSQSEFDGKRWSHYDAME